MNGPRAWEDDAGLFRALYPRLRRYAAVVAPSSVEPDDLLQEVVAKTLEKRQLCELEHPEAYLKRAMLNTAISHHRSAGRFMKAVLRLAPAGSSQDTPPSDLADLDRLNPTDRAVLYLSDVEGLAHSETGQVLGLSEAAVRARASRARRQLREALNEEDLR